MKKMIRKVKSIDFGKLFKQMFPIITWLPHYNLQKLRGDIIAGITVGIMIIPLSIAASGVAGLPSEHGLYSTIAPGIIYSIFGNSKDLNIGPTIAMALFTQRYNSTFEPVGASTLAFFIGIALITMAILRLSFIANFMPSQVLNGFVTAIAITLVISQSSVLFGQEKAPPGTFNKVVHFFRNIPRSNWWDLSMSAGCILFLALFMWLSKRNDRQSMAINEKKKYRIILDKILWFLCVGRNGLVCILCTVTAYFFLLYGYEYFTLAGKVPHGFPVPSLPLQTVVNNNNETITVKNFAEGFGTSLLILPIIQFIQTISISKTFAKKYNYDVIPSQELLALGLCNLVGSFLGGFPVTGSLARSSVNASSGASTPLSGAFTSIIIILALTFLTPLFQYIPKPTLGSMLTMAVVTMIDFKTPRSVWKANKIDMIPYLLAVLGSLYKLEVGVLVGAVVALFIMISREVRVKYDWKMDGNTLTVTFKQNLNYPCVENLKDVLLTLTKTEENISKVLIDLRHVDYLDYSIIRCLKLVKIDFKKNNALLRFTNVSTSIQISFEDSGILEDENINRVCSVEENMPGPTLESIAIDTIKNEKALDDKVYHLEENIHEPTVESIEIDIIKNENALHDNNNK